MVVTAKRADSLKVGDKVLDGDVECEVHSLPVAPSAALRCVVLTEPFRLNRVTRFYRPDERVLVL